MCYGKGTLAEVLGDKILLSQGKIVLREVQLQEDRKLMDNQERGYFSLFVLIEV